MRYVVMVRWPERYIMHPYTFERIIAPEETRFSSSHRTREEAEKAIAEELTVTEPRVYETPSGGTARKHLYIEVRHD